MLEQEYYSKQMSLREIARESGHDLKTILKLFKDYDIPRRNSRESWKVRIARKFPPEKIRQIRHEYEAGKRSLTDLEKEFGIHRHTLATLLRREGVATRKPAIYLQNRPKTPEHRRHISEGRKAMLHAHPERIENIRAHRLKQILPKKDTSIERLIGAELKNQQMPAQKHLGVEGICIPDFTFSEEKIAVFCDGDYWHRRPDVSEKDERVNKKLRERGWLVLRFWERDIKNNPAQITQQIILPFNERRRKHGSTTPQMERVNLHCKDTPKQNGEGCAGSG